MPKRRVLPPLLAFALCGLVLTLWACALPTRPPLNGAAFDPPVVLPPLNFTRSTGGAFTSADARGRISLFFFGYTHCADVCPLTLAELTQMRHTLGGAAEQVDMYFVTLDPTRDTPARMRAYVANFPGVVGLVGSDAVLADAQATFHVVAEKRELEGGDYLLDHTAAIYLVNRKAEIQLAYPYGTDPDDIVADVRQLVGSPSASAAAPSWPASTAS